jgi:competence protein ComEC
LLAYVCGRRLLATHLKYKRISDLVAFSQFLFKEWLAADADARLPNDPTLGTGVACDDGGCVTALADGALVTLALQPDAFVDDCVRATIIVTVRQPPGDCGATVIDRDRLQKTGATALRQTRGGFVIDAIRPKGLDRPWAPAAPDTVEAAGGAILPARQRALDATPAETDVQADEL